jgi:integrase
MIGTATKIQALEQVQTQSQKLTLKNKVENIKQDLIGKAVENFLQDKRSRSENTYKNYKIDINQFFNYLFNKEYQFIAFDELENIISDDIIEYRNALVEAGKANTTINRKITSVRKLFGYLEASNPNVRRAIFNVAEKLKENDRNGYGVLTWEEASTMIELAKELKDGDRLSLMIELAVKTCYRLRALIELTPSHIYQEEQNGQVYHVIKIIDKGEKHEKPISDDMYNRLMELVKEPNEHFFPYSVHTVGRRFQSLVTDMNLDERRNITFHSLKKCGINFVFDSTGNIMLAQKQGNHKSASTTMESYLKHQTDYSKMPSYTMGDRIDLQPLESLTKEELIELIQKSSSGAQLELLRLSEK